MGLNYIGVGNIGADGELKDVVVKDDDKQVAELRVFIENRVRNKETNDYEDDGGHWVTVEVWGRMAPYIAKLKKGMRVEIWGEKVKTTWKDEKTGEDKSRYIVYADRILVDPICL